MDTSDGGGREGLLDDNVVRLPRDWLGPREELIPIGRSEDGPSDSDAASSGEAFWGESSASIQDALQPLPQTRNPTAPRGVGAGSALRRRAVECVHRHARAFSVMVAASVLVAVAVLATAGHSSRH